MHPAWDMIPFSVAMATDGLSMDPHGMFTRATGKAFSLRTGSGSGTLLARIEKAPGWLLPGLIVTSGESYGGDCLRERRIRDALNASVHSELRRPPSRLLQFRP